MLNKLLIKNIALIDYAEINFEKGLNVLSGETGSGKSVIIESLNFVLGAKADKSLIRSGETECMVSAEFSILDNSKIKSLFLEFDFEDEDLLLITRKFNLDGKSSIKINGNTVTLSMLKKFTEVLVDIHGQSEHFSLLSKTNQLALIDSFGGVNVEKVKLEAKQTYSKLKDINKQIEELGGDESSRLMRIDILSYQIKEIEDANLIDGEDEELLIKKQKLVNQEKIVNGLSAVKQSFSEEGGIEDILSNAKRSLSFITNFSTEYQELLDRLENAFTELEDVSNTAENYLQKFEDSDLDADYIENRLELIKKLKKKYGSNFNEITSFLQQATSELDKLQNFNELSKQLVEDKLKISKILYDNFINISSLRKKFAEDFSLNVCNELKSLGMSSASFTVKFEEIKPFCDNFTFNSSNGLDNIEFLFSANHGEPLKPMSNVISGGEMSRFMLAIKSQSAKFSNTETFIFDEIDAGISGKTALVVAQKFADVSRFVQLITITHLPQISAMADFNLLISKNEDNDRTHTIVSQLDYQGKLNELARLIGGDTSETAIEHSKNMVLDAEKYKKNLV